MSIKLPGIGKRISNFQFSSLIDNQGFVQVSITSPEGNKHFELRPDTNWDTAETIKAAVDTFLTLGQGPKNVKISDYKERSYLFFGDYQFSGEEM